ncbi:MULTISPECIES: histidine phosphatase family protein [Alcaligenaceae]|uniref:Putative phosphoglycerate mutase n=1 Tax=Eoetvoesiella caeni TaxID=645616 RepID=A0A366H503_9BURK|nr:histidine phosphatase family protein [Eoetvoesiella caeni]MCI2810346.1 histidine phosphatase family protein [Eoetvoesiella caeni]NYT54715.1 histidine phosphatase family protein [Eoetvoesiella caeni]RBP37116.1 putative phosphoglycerate mutase [Eoetvoesiella caeni]
MSVSHQRVTKLYLIRHGQTAYNRDDRLRGHADPELTDLGYEQAEALGRIFAGVMLSRVVSSPLRRALDTARPIACAAGVPVEMDDDLNDRDYGRWTGASRAAVLQQFGSVDAAPGVEPWDTLCGRVMRAFWSMLETSTGPAFAMVGHDATNRVLLTGLVNELKGKAGRIHQDNGCWNRLDWNGHRWVLAVLNAVPQDHQHP